MEKGDARSASGGNEAEGAPETRREVLRAGGWMAAGVAGAGVTGMGVGRTESEPPPAPRPAAPAGRDRFDKFAEGAKRALVLAAEEARRLNHNYIGTEHLLLGLVREGSGVAAQVLGNAGVELNKVRGAVEFIIGRGDRMVIGDISLTPRAKKVVELSVEEARRLNHSHIGTEHLLLGLVREGEGIAAGVLENLGVRLEGLQQETWRLCLGRDTAPGA